MTEAPDILQEQVEEQTAPGRKKFGVFAGVFTPTLLTILGVIMYLREGWVVGNAGLLGAGIIILLAFAITTATGLSMSSLTTNIRIGAGGAFSIISQSLGLEVGGSVGIPLYLSQALAVAMYVFGFREGWCELFEGYHPLIVHPLIVDLATFIVLFIIAFISANLAFRVQYVIIAIIVASLISIFGTFFKADTMAYPVTWWGEFPAASFWVVFAVFFPAATGIMAGANLSGELKEPRRSIPIGTMSAIGLSFVIYLALAYWLARVATMNELTDNYTIMVGKALWKGRAVLAGLLGATFSSGLSSFVGAPRILQALGTHNILPGSHWYAKRSKAGEPRNAMWVTGGIVFCALLLRDLNAIAPLITMFFLITYAMLNVVVLIEQSLGLVSFRPLLRVPRIIPLLGAAGCLLAMFIVNPIFSLVAVVIVVVFYGILTRRRLEAPFADVRSGLFFSLAEWAAKRVTEMLTSQERAWKPNLLVPVEDLRELRGMFRFIHNLTYPRGSVKLVGLSSRHEERHLATRLPNLARAFREEGVFASWTLVNADKFSSGVLVSMQALSGTFFRPNIVLLTLPPEGDSEHEAELGLVMNDARQNRMGVLLFAEHPRAKLGRKRIINVWLREQGPAWQLSMELGSNLNLAILTAYKLKRNWNGSLNIITTIKEADQVAEAEKYLNNLVELARIPDAEICVRHCDFDSGLPQTPQADLNIFGLPKEPDFEFVRRMVDQTHAACVFVRDSGEENALA